MQAFVASFKKIPAQSGSFCDCHIPFPEEDKGCRSGNNGRSDKNGHNLYFCDGTSDARQHSDFS